MREAVKLCPTAAVPVTETVPSESVPYAISTEFEISRSGGMPSTCNQTTSSSCLPAVSAFGTNASLVSPATAAPSTSHSRVVGIVASPSSHAPRSAIVVVPTFAALIAGFLVMVGRTGADGSPSSEVSGASGDPGRTGTTGASGISGSTGSTAGTSSTAIAGVTGPNETTPPPSNNAVVSISPAALRIASSIVRVTDIATQPRNAMRIPSDHLSDTCCIRICARGSAHEGS